MKIYALIDAGYVTQVVEDPNDMSMEDWAAQFPPSFLWADATDAEPRPVVGWVAEQDGDAWDFHPYIPPPPPPPSAEDLRTARNSLLNLADIAINTLTDVGMETSSLKTWRQALRDVPQQEGFPLSYSFPPLPGDASLPPGQIAAIEAVFSIV